MYQWYSLVPVYQIVGWVSFRGEGLKIVIISICKMSSFFIIIYYLWRK